MKRNLNSKSWMVLLLAIGTNVPVACGTTISNLSALGANDVVDWSVAHPAGGQTISVTSSAGLGLTISELFSTFNQETQGKEWAGLFPNGTVVESNQFGSASTIAFSAPVFGIGLMIDDAFGGSYTGTIQEFHDATLLGSYHVASTPRALMFLGVRDATADITSVVVSLAGQGGDNYYAFGNLSLLDSAAATSAPEPGAACLALTGLLGVVAGSRKWRSGGTRQP